MIALLRLLGVAFAVVGGYSYIHRDLLLTLLCLCASAAVFRASRW